MISHLNVNKMGIRIQELLVNDNVAYNFLMN